MSHIIFGVGNDKLHHAYFKSGILLLLSAGAVWGATMLLRIAHAGSFTAVSIHDVNAHGNAQIFGWAGLLVMGLACGVLPRLLDAPLWRSVQLRQAMVARERSTARDPAGLRTQYRREAVAIS